MVKKLLVFTALTVITIGALLCAAAVLSFRQKNSFTAGLAGSISISVPPTLTPTPVPTPPFNPANLSWDEITPSAAFETRDSHGIVVYKDKMWIFGGLDANGHVLSPGNVDYGNAPHFSDVWSSSDGKDWNLVLQNAPWGQRRSAQVVEFLGKMWLVGGWGPKIGYQSDVWSSADGVNWTEEASSAAFPAREGHQLLVFNNKIWLIGGVRYDKHKLFNDVWYSKDGVNWIEATENAGWEPRWDFASEVFQNKIWLVGGMKFHDDKLFNDVWYSEDGINWTLASANPPFLTRQGLGLVDYQNMLWVVSRLNIPLYGGGPNDVWYSEDGIDWQKTTANPNWTGREDVGVVVFQNKIWIVGGMDENWQWRNDVWNSTF